MPQDLRPLTIHACFREHAGRAPGAVAVRHGELSWTYAELDAASDAVAASLAARGVRAGQVVPVLLERGPLLVAVLLGVLKAGGAYTPMDPRWPAERRAEVLAQVSSPVVVTDLPGVTADRAWDPGAVLAPPAASVPAGPVLPDAVDGADPCAVYFTSGTTGRPRGVLVPHEGTVRLFRDATFARLGPGAAVLQGSALAWDGLSLELWSMLTTGGTCLLPQVPTVTGDTVRQAVASGLTLLFLTSTLFGLLVDEDLDCFTGVAHVMTGGERFSPPHAQRFVRAHPGTRLTNVYGPVETSILLTAHDVRPEDLADPAGVPLGTALADTELHLLAPGAPGDREVPDGEVGELHVAGPRLGLGYLGEPDHPAFAVRRVAGGVRRTYATGDLAVRRDGLLHFAGRRDRQVKVRGHRIEPAEVEAVVHTVPGVASCRVVPLPDGAGAGVGGLGAFWTPAATAADPVRVEALVRERITAALPAYARPQVLRRLGRLPVTGTGKLDERALVDLAGPPTAPTASSGAAAVPRARQGTDDPRGRVVREEVAALVGPAAPPAGRTLTELGVTSLDLARLGMRLQRRLGVRMPPEELAGAADVEDLVRRAAAAPAVLTAHTVPVAAGSTRAPVAPSPLQGLLAVTPQQTPEKLGWLLCPVVWALRGEAPPTAVLAAALQDVQDRHEALRSAWETENPQGPRAVPLDAERAPRVPLLDLGDLHRDDRDGQQAQQRAQDHLVAALSATGLALDEGRTWRAGVLRVAPGHWLLGVVVHHTAFDGWSVAVMAEDLSVALAARAAGRAPRWASPAPTSAALADEREALGRYHDDPGEVAAWREHLADTVPVLFREASRPCSGPCPPGAHLHRHPTAPGAIAAWQAFGAQQGSTLFPVVLAVTARALRGHLHHPQVLMSTVFSARDSPVEEHAVSCLLDIRYVRTPVAPPGASWSQSVGQAQAELDWGQQHARTSFVQVMPVLPPVPPDRARGPEIFFALQSNRLGRLEVPGCRVDRVPAYPPVSETALTIQLEPEPGNGMTVVISHRCEHVSDETAATLADDITALLDAGPA